MGQVRKEAGRYMSARVLAILWVSLSVALVACAPTEAATSTPMPTSTRSPSSAPWRLVDEQIWENRLRLSLWVQNDTVDYGETLHVRAWAENVSGEATEYVMANIGDPPISVGILNPFGSNIGLRALGEPTAVAVSPAVNAHILEPGHKVEREVQWDITVPTKNGAIPAPVGAYTLLAGFASFIHDAPSYTLLFLSHKINVARSKVLISPEDARRIAEAQPQVQRWLADHSRDGFSREDDVGYFINVAGAWRKVDGDTFDRARNTWPTSEVEFASERGQGRWWAEVAFASRYGPLPQTLTVSIDAETGEVEQ